MLFGSTKNTKQSKHTISSFNKYASSPKRSIRAFKAKTKTQSPSYYSSYCYSNKSDKDLTYFSFYKSESDSKLTNKHPNKKGKATKDPEYPR
ncbi:hypothetical protein DSO57_1006697 [Entomophthora muscae]|uniref:Uncharacterized protein n=1 Tax=Entomophthora muscae TaxID=34485 RepID=A0ACC2UI58_9FUNG|nr:hypothetical protein DSO57_1006697 [Entomophthora muscae]